MKVFRPLYAFVTIIVLTGCVTIPKESVTLSQEMQQLVRSSRTSHLALLENYRKREIERINDFLTKQWTPTFFNKLVERSTVIQDLNNTSSNTAKAKVMIEFSQDALNVIEEKRTSMVSATNEIFDAIRAKINAHYDCMDTVATVLTAHLSSAANVSQARDEMLKQINLPVNQIVKIDNINGILSDIIAATDHAEQIKEIKDKAIEKIKQEQN